MTELESERKRTCHQREGRANSPRRWSAPTRRGPCIPTHAPKGRGEKKAQTKTTRKKPTQDRKQQNAGFTVVFDVTRTLRNTQPNMTNVPKKEWADYQLAALAHWKTKD